MPRPEPEAKATKVASHPATSGAVGAANAQTRAVTDGMGTNLRHRSATHAHRPSPRLKQGGSAAKQSTNPALEKAFEKAASVHARHALAFQRADALRKSAQSACDLAAETGGKGKKAKGQPSDDELQEELVACQQRSSEAQAVLDESKNAMDVARSKLDAARAEAEAKAKLEQAAALEARLRSIHLNATGRWLPSRLPGVIMQAQEQVKHHPEQILMASKDMKSVIESLAVQDGLTYQQRTELRHSTKSLNPVFNRLVQQQTEEAEQRLEDDDLTPKEQIEIGRAIEEQHRRQKLGLVSYQVVRHRYGLGPHATAPSLVSATTSRPRPASAAEARRPGGISTPRHRQAPNRPHSGNDFLRRNAHALLANYSDEDSTIIQN